jgi:4-hydroxy-3-methylbut-2-enyl diphosphate reductase IspH
VQTAAELSLDWFHHADRVGILRDTTPDTVIDAIEARLETAGMLSIRGMTTFPRHAMKAGVTRGA